MSLYCRLIQGSLELYPLYQHQRVLCLTLSLFGIAHNCMQGYNRQFSWLVSKSFSKGQVKHFPFHFS